MLYDYVNIMTLCYFVLCGISVFRAIWSVNTPTVSSSSDAPGGSPIVRSAAATSEGVGGQIFRSMLETAQNNPVEFRVVIDILVHRIHWGQEISGCVDNTNSVINSTTSIAGNMDKDAESKYMPSEVKVWVHSSGNSSSCPVELVCPPLTVVSMHSCFLSACINELISYWSTIPDIKGKVTKQGQFPPDFRALEGEFDIWQEVN